MRITYCEHCSRRVAIEEELEELADEPAYCDNCRRLPAQTLRNGTKALPKQERSASLKKTSGHLKVARIPAASAAPARAAVRSEGKTSGIRRAVQAVMSLVW
jgi:hypothetical protein